MQTKFQSLRSMGMVMPFWVFLLVFGSMFIPMLIAFADLAGSDLLPAQLKLPLGIVGLISSGISLAWHLPIWRVDPEHLTERQVVVNGEM